ncbi:MAG: GEVED domain-containing protein [Algibacter sp.]|uniref:GEVED domain-containing protein n=1 Tax=Algibacter sp. TaxID=1872428 RepID=UPI00262ECB6B|nr:GEVED domain-containing protein [Algibacter sp.]MDG1731129.1 GEVED domain-containing protein [Algibacter sp.]MDG2179747.1 GEVED domain-containing protein [Algibacter sp.]
MRHILYLLLFSFFITTLPAQNNQGIWSKVSKKEAAVGKKLLRKTEPSKSVYYQLDINKLKRTLNDTSTNTLVKKTSNIIILFPNSEGGFDEFKINESSILEPKYQEKHPEIRTYIGQNVKNPSSILSFSITPRGLHAMVLSSKTGTQFIDPYSNNNTYVVYNKGDLPALKKEFQCLVPDDITEAKETSGSSKSSLNANDRKLRTFRLALASTIEYSEFHWMAAGLTAGDTETDKKAAVLAAMVTTMNRVNTIFQRDLAIKMVLVDNTNIIFINSDNFSNDDSEALIDESQVEIDFAATTTPFSYDIGHTFSTGGGGLASLNSPCVNDRKAKGITGLSVPVGDAYDIDFVAHELGHQFGAPHTFNGSTGNCAGGNRTASNAYEPGSGSTIMAYAGICSPQNVQSQSDAYFHQKSIQMIWDNITTGLSTCGAESDLSNRPPIALAGPDYIIPISTAYKLVGNSTDPDGIAGHTYTWEQYDLGASGTPEETNTTGPLVRSFEGTSNPVRNIPKFEDYIASSGSTTWEKLPSVNRTMTFALTVRDNDVVGPNGGGQTDVDFMNVIVNSTDAFTVVNPIIWAQGSTQNIEWVVGQSANVSTINCQEVNIKLSTDGGLTFPTILASNTPNDGSFSFTVPSTPNTNEARILIEAADNIFYDVSDFNFSISNVPDFFIANESLAPINCNETEIVYTFDYAISNGFSENIVFSASNIPGSGIATFSPTNLDDSGIVTLTLSNLDGVSQGNYNITVTGSSSSSSKTKDKIIDLPFFNSICVSAGNLDFLTSTTFVGFNTISNASGNSDYSDFTGISSDVVRNTPYDLIIDANTDGNFTTNTRVWIDWNQNCSFNDPGETYNLGDATNVSNGITGLSPLTITIPSDASLGNTIMRVSTKFKDDGLPSPCEINFDGEVEDYTLNILPIDLNFNSSITSVQFNTINQISEKTSEYSNFSSVITDINRNTSYDLSIRVSTERDFTTLTKAWIDWNQNSSFDDAGEAYDLGTATNATNQLTGNSPLSILIPENAILGNTTMRIATIYTGNSGNQEPMPSGDALEGEGEVEDYTVNIQPTLSIEEFGFENLIVFPNPNHGIFSIKLNGSLTRHITIEAYNISGQIIANKIFDPTGDFNQIVNFNYLQSGMYFLHISDGKKIAKKKIIIY